MRTTPTQDGQAGRTSEPRSASLPAASADAVVAELVAAAKSAGIDLDREDARHWLQAVAAALTTPGEFACTDDGEFGGHELALIDFDPVAAERLRRIGRVIATRPRPGVRTALAIAGSAAQGRHQLFPADADFFERVHIAAPTREEAIETLADIVREDATRTAEDPAFHLEEVYFGVVRGVTLCWLPEEIAAGLIERAQTSGQSIAASWHEAARDPGFVKIDWALVDRALGGPGKVSKVIDATWEDPNGSVVSLDGAIDADYQQVYLDAEAADLADALTAGLAPGSRDHYLWLMEREIAKHCGGNPADYAKVAKRLYNLCRLTGRFAEALYLRELFDEPAARLDQLRVQLELADRLRPEERVALATDVLEIVRGGADWCPEDDRDALGRWARWVCEANVPTEEPPPLAPGEILARLVSAAFERRLRAYSPVSSLVDEIRARHAATYH